MLLISIQDMAQMKFHQHIHSWTVFDVSAVSMSCALFAIIYTSLFFLLLFTLSPNNWNFLDLILNALLFFKLSKPSNSSLFSNTIFFTLHCWILFSLSLSLKYSFSKMSSSCYGFIANLILRLEFPSICLLNKDGCSDLRSSWLLFFIVRNVER